MKSVYTRLLSAVLCHVAIAASPQNNASVKVTAQVAKQEGGNQSHALSDGQGNGSKTAPAQHRAKLDVGFASFEKNMMDQIFASIRTATAGGHWSSQLQTACKDNVTQELSEGLKAQLAPLKLSIGKTWMSLPEDEQKNGYVDQLRSAYEPVFKDVLGTIDSHLQRSLKRLSLLSGHTKKQPSTDALLAQCSSAIVGNMLQERCYDVGGEQHMKKANSFLQMQQGTPKNFCMPSVIEALCRRLHDSQGLIGMTMQFESKSMSLQATPGAIDDIVQQAKDAGR